jgi:glucosamine 6-phosphate synthetase-like amidotransferase/phosphosugar isomerase protein
MNLREISPSTNTTVLVVGAQGTGAAIPTGLKESSGAVTSGYTDALTCIARIVECGGTFLGLQKAIEHVAQIDDTIGGLEVSTRCVEVLGYGTNTWTAKECALKLREAARLPSAGWPYDEYAHGAFASLRQSDHLIMLDSGQPEKQATVSRILNRLLKDSIYDAR